MTTNEAPFSGDAQPGDAQPGDGASTSSNSFGLDKSQRPGQYSSSFEGIQPPPGAAVVPRGPRPWVTIVLCLSMLLVWVLEISIPEVVRDFAFSPLLGLFEPWRFLSAAFLHSIPMPFHLAFNVWALWVVGRPLENVLGHFKLAVAFVICALGAMLAQCVVALVNPAGWLTLSVGASGAVFGFFGLVLAIQRVLRLPWTEMGVLIGINFALGFVFPNIAWAAHVGGLLLGLILGFYTGWTLRRDALAAPNRGVNRTRRSIQDAGFYLLLLVLLVASVWMFYHFNYEAIYNILGFIAES